MERFGEGFGSVLGKVWYLLGVSWGTFNPFFQGFVAKRAKEFPRGGQEVPWARFRMVLDRFWDGSGPEITIPPLTLPPFRQALATINKYRQKYGLIRDGRRKGGIVRGGRLKSGIVRGGRQKGGIVEGGRGKGGIVRKGRLESSIVKIA